jgi:hypothetical protein
MIRPLEEASPSVATKLGHVFSFNIQMRTTTGLNARESWQVRHRRTKKERASVAGHLVTRARQFEGLLRSHLGDGGALSITLTRISPSPRRADNDNATAGLKAVRDQLAAWLGVDDGDGRLTWLYAQERGPWAVRVAIGAVAKGGIR